MQSKNFYSNLIGFELLASSVTASAQVYVGGGLGQAKPKSHCFSETSCNQSDSAFKLIGGYTIDKNFAIELNYFDFGSQHFSYSADQMSTNLDLKSRALSLSGLLNYSFTDKFGGFVKAGIAQVKSEDSLVIKGNGGVVTDYSGHTTFKDPHVQLGVGLTYKISDRFSLRAEFEQFRLKSRVQRTAFQTVTVGAQYAF